MQKRFIGLLCAVGLALGLFSVRSADALSVCRICTVQGVTQGAGIVPDPGKLRVNLTFSGLSVRTYRAVPTANLSFLADGYPASTAGNFDLTGYTTTSVKDDAGFLIQGSSRLVRTGTTARLTVRNSYGKVILLTNLTVGGQNFTGGGTRLAGDIYVYETDANSAP